METQTEKTDFTPLRTRHSPHQCTFISPCRPIVSFQDNQQFWQLTQKCRAWLSYI